MVGSDVTEENGDEIRCRAYREDVIKQALMCYFYHSKRFTSNS